MSAFRDEHVGGFDVPMDDAFGVGSVEGFCNLNSEFKDLLKRKRLAVDVLAEGFAVDKFHGDERPIILLSYVVDGADAGMVQSGGGVKFTAKTFESLRVLDHVFGQKFQGDRAVETGVEGLENYTHSASELVAADDFGDGALKFLRESGALLGRDEPDFRVD